MLQLPEFLKSGEVARLFPVIAETGKEQKASSIFLSVISAVPPFANALLCEAGQRVGARSSVNTFTEVVFNSDPQLGKTDRPDGLIEVSTGKRQWSALFEAKVGNSDLEKDQIERYLRLARDNNIDAVITVSNEFAALPTHHPIAISKTLTRKVALYHFSWTSILTVAVLLHERSVIEDPEQAFLLREFIRFFSHPSAGVKGYTSMPKDWSSATEKVLAGGNVQKEEGEAVVGAWHQELRDLSLLMSRLIGCRVSVKISNAHANDAEKRLRDDLAKLCSKGLLETTLQIPDAASGLRVIADLRSRSLRISMCLDAPKDKVTTKARLNWLMRQLKNDTQEGISIGMVWASRASTSILPLEEIREHPEVAINARAGSEVRAFEVTLASNSARRFMGPRTFIEELEHLAPSFYEKIGQHLHAWKPSPPKPKHSVNEEKEIIIEVSDKLMPRQAGNAHGQLLEIPEFLQRISIVEPIT